MNRPNSELRHPNPEVSASVENPFWFDLVRLFGVLLFALLAPGVAWAQSPAGFEPANKLYEEGRFTEAASAYEKLAQSGQTSAALYFNLGNAFFKSGQIGRAITAYRQAEKITPRDPDVRANLQFARNQIQGPSLMLNWWQLWLRKLSLDEWTTLAAVPVWLCLLLLALQQWRPGLKPPLRGLTATLGLAALLLCGCLAAAWHQVHALQVAVVIKPEAVVRHGPLDESQAGFTARDGSELRVLDQKDEWLQVTTDSRHIGWVRRDQVLLIPQTKV